MQNIDGKKVIEAQVCAILITCVVWCQSKARASQAHVLHPRVKGQKVELVEQFVYLGSQISSSSALEWSCWKYHKNISRIWPQSYLSLKSRPRINISLIVPILLYYLIRGHKAGRTLPDWNHSIRDSRD